jgi:hypothetical protein
VGQGNDIASQHRSAIYTNSDEQLAATQASRDRYQANLDQAGDGTITTEVAPGGPILRRGLRPAVPGSERPWLLHSRLLRTAYP